MFLRNLRNLINLTNVIKPTNFKNTINFKNSTLIIPTILPRIVRHNHFYTKSHEFIHFIKDDVIRIGLSKYAIDNMGEIVYIGVEEIGEQYDKGDNIVVIESIKAASEISAPEDGIIMSHNNDIIDNIGNFDELMKKNELDLWLLEFQISNTIDKNSLMKINDYNNFVDNTLQFSTNIIFS